MQDPRALDKDDDVQSGNPQTSLCAFCLALLSDIPTWSRPLETESKIVDVFGPGEVEIAYQKQFATSYEQLKASKAGGCKFCATLYDFEQEHEAYVFSQRTGRVREGPFGPMDASGPLDDYETRYLLEDERLFESGNLDMQLKCLVRELSSFPDLGYLQICLYEEGRYKGIGRLNILAEKGW